MCYVDIGPSYTVGIHFHVWCLEGSSENPTTPLSLWGIGGNRFAPIGTHHWIGITFNSPWTLYASCGLTVLCPGVLFFLREWMFLVVWIPKDLVNSCPKLTIDWNWSGASSGLAPWAPSSCHTQGAGCPPSPGHLYLLLKLISQPPSLVVYITGSSASFPEYPCLQSTTPVVP